MGIGQTEERIGMDSKEREALKWLASGDTGLSSEVILYAGMGIENPRRWWGFNYPHDPDDLGRCLRLLKLHPWLREPAFAALQERDRAGIWPKLIHHWDQLAEMMEEEVGINWEKGDVAPKTYRAMKNIGC